MHYYQFNIGDYASHTSRLKPIEDLAYRRMLDLYYLNEQPLSLCLSDVAREIGLTDYLDEVTYVLNKFFIQTEFGFSQKRIDLEIKKYKTNHKSKIKAGKASAKARLVKASSAQTSIEHALNTRTTNDELNINHKPLNINHKPLNINQELVVKDTGTKAKRFMPPTLDQVHFYCNERLNNVDANKFIDHYTSNGWLVGKNKMKDWKAAIRTWEKSSFDKPSSNKPASRPVSTTRFF